MDRTSPQSPPPGCQERQPPTAVAGRTAARRLRLFALALAGLVGFGTALAVGGNLYIVRQGGRHSVGSASAAPHAQVAIVLGAKVRSDGSPSSMLEDRLITAVDLYRQGAVDKLLLSGDHGTTGYDEVNSMRAYVIAEGVPPEDVFMDHAGFSTYDTMFRARDVFLVRDALVITQGFHLDRAVYTARALGLDATGVRADRRPYLHEGRFAARDWLARCKALVQLHLLRTQPRYLGPVLPISGDGRTTAG